jgi:hypothetical protein
MAIALMDDPIAVRSIIIIIPATEGILDFGAHELGTPANHIYEFWHSLKTGLDGLSGLVPKTGRTPHINPPPS